MECVKFVEQKVNNVYNHISIFYAFLSPNSVLCCKTLHSNRIVCVYCLKLTLLPQNIVGLMRCLQFRSLCICSTLDQSRTPGLTSCGLVREGGREKEGEGGKKKGEGGGKVDNVG